MPQKKGLRRILGLVFTWLAIYTALLFIYRSIFRHNSPVQQQQRQHFSALKLLPDYKCACAGVEVENGTTKSRLEGEAQITVRKSPLNATRRVLLVTDRQLMNTAHHKQLLNFFNSLKTPIHVEEAFNADLLLLEIDGMAQYSLIVFENYLTFHRQSGRQKQLLNAFCTLHSIGLISFLKLDEGVHTSFPTFNAIGGEAETLTFASNLPTMRIGKIGCPFPLPSHERSNWTLFEPNNKSPRPLLKATTSGVRNGSNFSVALLLPDEGHVVFTARPEHWMVKIALFEAISHLAPNIYEENLERFIQVDIDDIFVGATGSRLTPDDVNALISVQEELRRSIDNFTFTLGFSGYYFRHGNQLEVEGDEALLANADKFHWFPHMWRHNHAPEHSANYLLALMAQNRMFANTSGLRTRLNYAISPQHSGVYPIYQPLYDGWKQIWDVKVTSTEEYPHLKPASRRRGFTHSGIAVLPRQTCGLFTHTQHLHAYPEGIGHFLGNIYGGDLFHTILMNKHSIFMTHQQNYANDRLGLFTFVNLLNFIRCWTNLKLRWVEPKRMADLYFEQFPDERVLLHTDICADKRHRRMLPANNSCTTKGPRRLPNLLIVGPQKTGTTALAQFLHLHPNVSTNRPIPHSFEELQFFAGPNYAKGVDWYVEKFALDGANASATSPLVVFEKTANYFDNPRAPQAVQALIPGARVLVILEDPVRRAYSWYQHMRAHNDTSALKYSPEEVFMSNATDAERLRKRALLPGLYATHLNRWLDHFPASQLLVVDGHRLRSEPHFVLNELFARLELPAFDGLVDRLKFSKSKGFYCLVAEEEKPAGNNGTNEKKNGTKTTPIMAKKLNCLGSSKGRQYEAMSQRLRLHLETYFSAANAALRKLLKRHRFPVPFFLKAF